MTVDNKQLRSTAVTYGLFLGIIITVFGIVAFYIMIGTTSVILISAVPFIFSMVFPIIILVVLSLNLRKRLGGFWDFKQASTGIFIMLLVAFAVQFIVRDQIFARVIEPDMTKKTGDAMIKAVTSFLQKSNTSQEIIDKKIDDIQKQLDSSKDVSIGKQIQGFGISIIFLFVLAIIFAAFFKKEGHPFNPNLDYEDPRSADPTV